MKQLSRRSPLNELRDTQCLAHGMGEVSGKLEDIVRSNASPDHVGLSRMDLWSVLEGCATVRCPGHLEDARDPTYTLNT